jgi:hypothetical protein
MATDYEAPYYAVLSCIPFGSRCAAHYSVIKCLESLFFHQDEKPVSMSIQINRNNERFVGYNFCIVLQTASFFLCNSLPKPGRF